MKEKFMQEFDIVRMSKSSLLLQNKKTGEHVYIHRNAFNKLDIAVEYRIVQREFMGNTLWLEVLCWESI
jgi:hypothetical protein